MKNINNVPYIVLWILAIVLCLLFLKTNDSEAAAFIAVPVFIEDQFEEYAEEPFPDEEYNDDKAKPSHIVLGGYMYEVVYYDYRLASNDLS